LEYWLDGYDPDKNTAIEVDEEHHFIKGQLSDKDITRQNKIINHLGCTVIRIRLRTMEVTIYKPTEAPVMNGIIQMISKAA